MPCSGTRLFIAVFTTTPVPSLSYMASQSPFSSLLGMEVSLNWCHVLDIIDLFCEELRFAQ